MPKDEPRLYGRGCNEGETHTGWRWRLAVVVLLYLGEGRRWGERPVGRKTAAAQLVCPNVQHAWNVSQAREIPFPSHSFRRIRSRTMIRGEQLAQFFTTVNAT
jgi:hypothetical protein